MRILFVSAYPPDRDGIGDYTAAMVRAVRRRGHEAAVLTPRPQAAPHPDVLGSVADDEAAERWAPDVVHLQFAVATFGTRLPALLLLLARWRNRPVQRVVTFHEVTRDTAALKAPGRWLYRRLARGCDLAIVHTEAALSQLRERVGAPQTTTRVVPHPRIELPPADTTPAALRQELGLGGRRLLLAFGFVHVHKGLDDLVEALGRMNPLPPDVHLLVAGDVRGRQGAFRLFEARDRLHLRRVRRRIAALGLEDRVSFTGYVPAGHVRPLFELAHAAVLPYRKIEQSGVIHLAAAAGTPVLASRAGDFARDIGTAWQFDPGAPGQLAATLATFLDLDASRARAAVDSSGSDMDTIADATLAAYAGSARREALHAHAA